MSDETIQYITTDYLIEVDGGDSTPAPIEYIVELGQVGVQGVPGEKGEPGFTPTVSYILNNDTFKINIVNQDGVTQTPNLYDYFADKNGYIKVDGSNADNPITINNIALRSYSDGAGRISTSGTLQLHGRNTNIYGTSVGIDVKANSIDFGNWSTGKYLEADTTVKYGTSSTKYEIATVNDIGNGTITLTQGGVTKGTFTTNQSGNTTIDLDAGGGSITNPLVINSDNGLKNLSIGYNNDNELSIISTWLYNGTVPIPMPAYLIGGTSNPISLSNTSANHGLKTINLNYDSNTLDLNSDDKLTVKGMVGADGTNDGSAGLVPAPTATDNTKFLRGDGTWQTVGGGSSYTEGTGIDITNNVISIDTSVVAQLSDIPDVSNFVTTSDLSTTLASYVQSSSLATVATTGNYTDLNGRPNLNAYVTLDTTQTISGTKTFSRETHYTGVITFDSALLNPIIRGMSGSSYRNMIYRMGNDSAIIVGNSSDTIDLKGSGTRPTYNTNSLALYSDIPTVPTNISSFTNDSGYITNSALSGYATETWVGSQGYLTSSDISDMATKTWVGQQGYLTGITSSDVTTALGYTPYNATNPDGFISGINSTMVVNALGYTPYSSSNPSGYTSNVGTVISVNNVQPDSNGNVTITPTITVIDGGNA